MPSDQRPFTRRRSERMSGLRHAVDSSAPELRQLGSAVLKQVEQFARTCFEEHLSHSRESARKRARSAVRREQAITRKEDHNRKQRSEDSNDRSKSDSHSLSKESDTPTLVSADPALAGLDRVLANFEKQTCQPDRDEGEIVVVMPVVENVPKYDAWVPVRTNYWVGKDMELEPYMPYFGDDNEGRSKAFDLFKDMAQDAKQEIELSDGEVNEKGEFIEPGSDLAWSKYESLEQVRFRAACRGTILQVLERFDENSEELWNGLSTALSIKSRARLQALAEVARARRKKEAETLEFRKKRERMRKEVVKALISPGEETDIREPGSLTQAALKNFCFTCQVFHCRQHLGRDVEPILPIADPTVDKRVKDLHSGRAAPCSSKCYMMESWKQIPYSAAESEPWTPEQLMLLRESTGVFRRDPCSLAIVVGTRSCREVLKKLEEHQEEALMRRAIAKAQQTRKVDLKLDSERWTNTQSRDNDSDVEDVPIVEVGVPKVKKKAHKRVERVEQVNESEDFMPCYHKGPCTVDSCSCVKRGMNCESTCACNNTRFGVGPRGTGISRYVDGEPCGNLAPGCLCKKGHCNKNNCECWRDDRACNPDVCSECDCNILPSQIESNSRRCRNVAVSIARHKRTYVGKSPVHGYGLFAGDYFEEGDLVGIYGGQLLDTRLADMVGRLYDAKDHTFFFDITESIVIDGGVLGMKSKFCNHAHSGAPDENVRSKMVRVRGEAHIALFTKRAVMPGEELKFDYKFQSVVPSWAKMPHGTKEEPMEIPADLSPRQRPRSKSRSS